MNNNKSYPSAWIYLFVLIGMIGAFVPSMREFSRVDEELRYKNVPLWSESQIVAEYQQVLNLILNPPLNSADEYFTVVRRAYALESLAMKYDYVSKEKLQRFGPNRVDASILLISLGGFQKEYEEKFKPEGLTAAGDSWEMQHKGVDHVNLLLGDTSPTKELNYDRAWLLLGNGYLLTVLLMVVFYYVRLARSDMLIAVEIPQIALASFLWPAYFWRYPKMMHPVEQFKRAMRFAGAVLSASLSLGTIGVKAGEKREEEPTPVSYNISGGVRSMYLGSGGFRISGYPMGWGSMTASTADGKYFSIWGIGSGDGEGGEIDYTAAWSKDFASGVHLTTRVEYFDIGALGTAKGGDVVSFGITTTKGVWSKGSHSLTSAIDVQATLLTKGKGNWNDKSEAGLTYSYTFTPKLSASVTISAVLVDLMTGNEGKGVGVSKGLSLSYKPTPQLTMGPYVRLFSRAVGLRGLDDLSTEFGASFSYSF